MTLKRVLQKVVQIVNFNMIRKRIEVLEQKTKLVTVPDLVHIFKSDKGDKWIVREDYNKKDTKGNILQGGSHKEFMIDDYKDYVIKPDFVGTLLLDLGFDEETDSIGLYSVNAAEVRKSLKINNSCGFSLEYIGESENIVESLFNVTVVEYK